MKNRLLRASTILAALALLVASGLPGTAQQQTGRQRPTDQQEERKAAEMPAQEMKPEMFHVAVPRECARIRPEVQMHGVPDNFKPPGDPVTPSPALTNWLNAHNTPRKGYDDERVNTFFADSFRLRSCRICYATLEVRVQHYDDNWSNDSIEVGAAPFNISPGVILVNALIWNQTTPNPTPQTYVLPAAGLNGLIMSGSMPSLLDVYVQDDTNVDYAKLSVWYY